MFYTLKYYAHLYNRNTSMVMSSRSF